MCCGDLTFNPCYHFQVSMDFGGLDRPRRRGPPVRALTEVRPDYALPLQDPLHIPPLAHPFPRPPPPLIRSDTLRTPYVEPDEPPEAKPQNVSAQIVYFPFFMGLVELFLNIFY